MNPATTIMCTALRPESAASYELACRYRRASVSTNWLFVLCNATRMIRVQTGMGKTSLKLKDI
jgi:hypothetical protein